MEPPQVKAYVVENLSRVNPDEAMLEIGVDDVVNAARSLITDAEAAHG